jgi:hypothetical protein
MDEGIKCFYSVTKKVFLPLLRFLNAVLLLYKCNMDFTKIRQRIVCLLMGLIFLYFFGDNGDL